MADFFEFAIRVRPEWIVMKLWDSMPPGGCAWWCEVSYWWVPGAVDLPELSLEVVGGGPEACHHEDEGHLRLIHESCVAPAVGGYTSLVVTASPHPGKRVTLRRAQIERALLHWNLGVHMDPGSHPAMSVRVTDAHAFFQLCCFGEIVFPHTRPPENSSGWFGRPPEF